MIKIESRLPTIDELKKIVGSRIRLIFFLMWLRHNSNATQAYLELHPNASYNSARVLGCRMLTKVNKQRVLAAYGLSAETYLKQLCDGMGATDRWGNPDHKTRRPYHEALGRLIGVE